MIRIVSGVKGTHKQIAQPGPGGWMSIVSDSLTRPASREAGTAQEGHLIEVCYHITVALGFCETILDDATERKHFSVSVGL